MTDPIDPILEEVRIGERIVSQEFHQAEPEAWARQWDEWRQKCLDAGYELLGQYEGEFEANGRVLGTGEMYWMCEAQEHAWQAIADRWCVDFETMLDERIKRNGDSTN